MESDRMGHLLGVVDQARPDEQRAVVKNKKRQGDNQPYGLVEYNMLAGLFPSGHPYSWSTIGSMEDLDAASVDDVRGWFQHYCGASNAVLCAPRPGSHRDLGRERPAGRLTALQW